MLRLPATRVDNTEQTWNSVLLFSTYIDSAKAERAADDPAARDGNRAAIARAGPTYSESPRPCLALRRMLESGEMATAGEIAMTEGVTDRFVSRTMRLAYLSPEVLEQMLVQSKPPAATWNDVVKAASAPWSQQQELILGH